MKIYIGGVTFDYEESNELFDYGECDKHSRVIRVHRSQPQCQKVDTILHEILHAIWDVYALEEKDDEERMVTCTARGLTCIYRDVRNKPFLDYLNYLRVPQNGDS